MAFNEEEEHDQNTEAEKEEERWQSCLQNQKRSQREKDKERKYLARRTNNKGSLTFVIIIITKFQLLNKVKITV